MDFKMLSGQSPSKNERCQELSIICEETLSSDGPYISEPKDLSCLVFDTNLPHAIENFHSHGGDSDESLGILPLDFLDDTNEVFSGNSSVDLSFLENDSKHDFIDNLNVVKENLFKTNDSLVEHGTPGLSTIPTSELQYDLNASQIIHSSEDQNNLNVTLTFSDHTFEFDELKKLVNKVNDDQLITHVCTLPNTPSLYKCEESPIHKDGSSPKYSSTPKHDMNTTFALDERFLNPGQNLSPVSTLNKTFNKEDALQDKVMLTNIDKLDSVDVLSRQTVLISTEKERSILNTTCNINSPLHHQSALNKTFNNVFNVAKKNVTITYPEKIENTFDLKDDKKGKITVAPPDNEDVINENIQLNVSSIDIFFPENFGIKTEALNSEGCEATLENSFNVSPVSKDIENISYEEVIATNVLDKTQILNTTYEKIDKQPKSSQNIQSSKFQKSLYMQVGMTNISKIAKGTYSSPFSSTASSFKSTKPDEKSIRKSICAPIGNNSKMNKEALKRRQTFGTTLIKNDAIGPNLISCTTKNTANSSHYLMYKNPMNRKSCSGYLKFSSKSKISSAEASKNFSDASFSISKVSSEKNKVKLYSDDESQLKQLGETVILPEKTVIKTSLNPPKKISNKCEIPRLSAHTSGRKTSAPLLKQVKVLQKAPVSSAEFQGKKTLSGIPEKRVLSQKNSSNACLPGASSTQILTRKSSSTGSSASSHQIGSVASKIPTTTSKKTGNEERAVFEKPKIYYLRNSSHRNLR